VQQAGSPPVCDVWINFTGEFQMNKTLVVFLLALICSFSTFSVNAAQSTDGVIEKKRVVALKTDDFELHETDISDLAVGEAETVFTESGKTIDLLRTAEGVEIYVDGELLDTGPGGLEGVHGEEDFDIDLDMEAHHGDGHEAKVIVIKKIVTETE
jgi:hypothetical protein